MKQFFLYLIYMFAFLALLAGCEKATTKQLIDNGNFKFWRYSNNYKGMSFTTYHYFDNEGHWTTFRNTPEGFREYDVDDVIESKELSLINDSLMTFAGDKRPLKIVKLSADSMILESSHGILDTMVVAAKNEIPKEFWLKHKFNKQLVFIYGKDIQVDTLYY